MRNITPVLALTVGLLASTSAIQQAQAFWPDYMEHKLARMNQTRQQNVMWPYPYVCPEREWTRRPFDIMVQNGWRQQNLLGAHHFEPESNKLTRAGELKVRWILTQAPEIRRQVFVERDIDPAITEERLTAAQEFAQVAAINGETPVVTDTHIVSHGRAAESVDLVNRSYQENMLPAVLPTQVGTGVSGQ